MADCEAVAELKRCAGSQLDPGVVAALLAIGPSITSGRRAGP